MSQPVPSYRARPQQLVRKVGAPLGLLIFAGILAGLLVVLAGRNDPVMFALGFLPAAIFSVLAILCYLWLDRWEPEPPRLLLFAYLWGAGFSTAFALAVGGVLFLLGFDDPVFTTAVQAPVVEEFAKGMFLVLMTTGLRRREMTTLIDCLVYAGLVGLGFAFIENLLYFSNSEDTTQLTVVAVLRLVFGVFAHPLFTSMTALGIYFSLRQRNPAARLGLVVAGFVAATLLHAAWNGSTFIADGLGYLVVYALLMVPVFAGAVTIAMLSRKREGEVVRRQLGPMVQQGLIIGAEADWMAWLPRRRARAKLVRQTSGKAAAKQVAHFTDAVTELAFVTERLQRGHGTEQTTQDQRQLIDAVVAERAAAMPALATAAAQAPPMGFSTPHPIRPGAMPDGPPGT